ncbi:hypothetical protein D3C75_745010 [compost metagenome]
MKLAHRRLKLWIIKSDNNPVRVECILNSRAFAQEFRSGDDIEGMIRVGSDNFADFLVRPNRNGRLGHDDFVAFHRLGDFRSCPLNISQVCFTARKRRRSYSENDDIRPAYRFLKIRGEG